MRSTQLKPESERQTHAALKANAGTARRESTDAFFQAILDARRLARRKPRVVITVPLEEITRAVLKRLDEMAASTGGANSSRSAALDRMSI